MEIKRTAQVLDPQLDSKQSGQPPFSRGLPVMLSQRQAVPPEQQVHVDVSTASRLRSQSQTLTRDNDDIAQSDLPEGIKKMLVHLRELQQKIMAKLAELQKLMNDTKMRADLRKQRIQMVQTEIMALEAGYMQAGRALEKLMTQLAMSTEQKMTVADLLMQ